MWYGTSISASLYERPGVMVRSSHHSGVMRFVDITGGMSRVVHTKAESLALDLVVRGWLPRRLLCWPFGLHDEWPSTRDDWPLPFMAVSTEVAWRRLKWAVWMSSWMSARFGRRRRRVLTGAI